MIWSGQEWLEHNLFDRSYLDWVLEDQCPCGQSWRSHAPSSLRLVLTFKTEETSNIQHHERSRWIFFKWKLWWWLHLALMLWTTEHSSYWLAQSALAVVYFLENAKFWTIWANLRTFWFTITGLNSAVVHQNWQIWGLVQAKFKVFELILRLKVYNQEPLLQGQWRRLFAHCHLSFWKRNRISGFWNDRHFNTITQDLTHWHTPLLLLGVKRVSF